MCWFVAGERSRVRRFFKIPAPSRQKKAALEGAPANGEGLHHQAVLSLTQQNVAPASKTESMSYPGPKKADKNGGANAVKSVVDNAPVNTYNAPVNTYNAPANTSYNAPVNSGSGVSNGTFFHHVWTFSTVMNHHDHA